VEIDFASELALTIKELEANGDKVSFVKGIDPEKLFSNPQVDRQGRVFVERGIYSDNSQSAQTVGHYKEYLIPYYGEKEDNTLTKMTIILS